MDPNQQPPVQPQPPIAPTPAPSFQPNPPMPGAPAPVQPNGEDPGKTLAIVGIILAFVFTLAGLVVSIVAKNKSKAAGFNNSLATVGIILNAAFMVLGLIIAAFMIMGTIAATNSLTSGIDKLDKDAKAQIDAKKDFAKGETGKFGNIEVVVNSVKRDFVSSNQYNVPKTGKEFIVVNVTVKNVSTETEYFSSISLQLNDNGVAGSSTYIAGVTDIDGGNLSPGASVTGDLPFEVTKGATGLKLQYEGYAFVIGGSKSGANKLTYTLAI